MYLIAGNWKMNGGRASMPELDQIIEAAPVANAELLLCPPATLLERFAARVRERHEGGHKGNHVAIGAQDCHPEASGAHTGDLAAEMLAEAGATHIIVGHSERRRDHQETNALVRAKAEAAIRAGCTPIVCVGETLAERRAGATLAVVRQQLRESLPEGDATVIVAYEPVWAIGSGLTPTAAEVAEVHAAIAALAPAATRILYGGSVKPDNARAILAIPHVDGALVGGASLHASDFLAIAAGAS